MNNCKEFEEIKSCFLIRGSRDEKFGYTKEHFEHDEAQSWKSMSIIKTKSKFINGLRCSDQKKAFTCISGQVYFVIVDLRPESSSYLKWQAVWLKETETLIQIVLPCLVGYGFYSAVDSTLVCLQEKLNNENIEINFFDKKINITLPGESINDYILAEYFKKLPSLNDIELLVSEKKLSPCYMQVLKTKKSANTTLIYGINSDILNDEEFIICGKACLEDYHELRRELTLKKPLRVLYTYESQEILSHKQIRTNLIKKFNLAHVTSELAVKCTILCKYGSNYSEAEILLDKIFDLVTNLVVITRPISDTPSATNENKRIVEYRTTNQKIKNILITGGAGFIGSHVAIRLCKLYPSYNIVVYDILDYCSNLKNLDSVNHLINFKFIKGDICNFASVQNAMTTHRIDTVLHFAAQSHVDISLTNSLKFTHTNVIGTHVLLECARQCSLARFIHVSTDEVYGTTNTVADINHALEPTNPYACSKLAAECMIKAYQKCFRMPIIITRCNNVYGPHQFLEKVIPKFIVRLLHGQTCCIHDDGSSERDFLYVSDVAEAFDRLLHSGQPGRLYNIGASQGFTVRQVAEKLIRIVRQGEDLDVASYLEFVPGRILDDKRYKIDSGEMLALGWSPKVEFNDGLSRTVEWYRNNLNHWPDAEYALEPHPVESRANKHDASEIPNSLNLKV